MFLVNKKHYIESFPFIILTFENEPNKLKLFLDRARANGGWGKEAVEVVFQYINDNLPEIN